VWFGIFAISSMALVQAMIFSFVERMGTDRGFGVANVSAVLIALGVVNMFPPGIAAVLDKRLNARTVVLVGPVVQAIVAVVMSLSSGFAPYAIAAAVFVSLMLFTHTFAFGMLAKLDVTGRAVAATPAMVMIGSAIGPILGGTIVKNVGYGGLGLAAAAIDVLAIVLFVGMTAPTPPVAATA
jgi:predicted MFS family arabinose efflux permease